MEYVDVLDCAGRTTGETMSRDEAHRVGAWHGAFHCFIIYELAGRGYALFQKRSAQKKIAPGKFDISVGGHYAAGEGAEAAGPRETREELGLTVAFKDLVSLGRRVFVYCLDPGVREYEFQDVFMLPKEIYVSELALQREELEGVVQMDLEQGLALFSGRTASVEMMLTRSDGKEEPVRLTIGDFVPCLDSYYLKLLLLAQRYFNGERALLFV